jgi:hypothetical protein
MEDLQCLETRVDALESRVGDLTGALREHIENTIKLGEQMAEIVKRMEQFVNDFNAHGHEIYLRGGQNDGGLTGTPVKADG